MRILYYIQVTNVNSPISEFALAYVHENKVHTPKAKFSLKDLIGDGFLLAVPKFRRTIEKRWKRKFGYQEYVWKMLVPKNSITVCSDCGHYHERGRLCGKFQQRLIYCLNNYSSGLFENYANLFVL